MWVEDSDCGSRNQERKMAEASSEVGGATRSRSRRFPSRFSHLNFNPCLLLKPLHVLMKIGRTDLSPSQLFLTDSNVRASLALEKVEPFPPSHFRDLPPPSFRPQTPSFPFPSLIPPFSFAMASYLGFHNTTLPHDLTGSSSLYSSVNFDDLNWAEQKWGQFELVRSFLPSLRSS